MKEDSGTGLPGRDLDLYKAVLFDLDGTLTETRSFWQYLHQRLGTWEGEADRHVRDFEAGRIGYADFCRLDAGCWKGMELRRLEAIAGEVRFRPGAAALLGELRARDWRVGVISTGLTLLGDRVVRELGVVDCAANHLESAGGRLTGRVDIRVHHGRKDHQVESFCRRHSLRAREVIGVGDSEGDVSMFRRTGHSIAYHPADGAVVAAADEVCPDGPLTDLLPLFDLQESRS